MLESGKWASRSHAPPCSAAARSALSSRSLPRETLDYSAYYAKGVTFAAFLDAATSPPGRVAEALQQLRRHRRHRLAPARPAGSPPAARRRETIPAVIRSPPSRTSRGSSTPRRTGSSCASSTLARAAPSWKPIGHPTPAQPRRPSSCCSADGQSGRRVVGTAVRPPGVGPRAQANPHASQSFAIARRSGTQDDAGESAVAEILALIER